MPFWIADTEFKLPKQAQKALEERVKHGVFGYSLTPKEYYEAYMNWQKKRYGTELHQEWIRFGTSFWNVGLDRRHPDFHVHA